MNKLASALLVLFALTTSACYHANVITGQPASGVVVDKPWHMGFVYGLVFPNDIDVSQECPNGVARVETELSFLNQLVSGITLGLISPMHVKVTCAAGPSTDAEIIKGSDEQAVLQEAAQRSAEQEAAVYVQITAAE